MGVQVVVGKAQEVMWVAVAVMVVERQGMGSVAEAKEVEGREEVVKEAVVRVVVSMAVEDREVVLAVTVVVKTVEEEEVHGTKEEYSPFGCCNRDL